MGILNVTPDSFAGDGVLAHENYVIAALNQASQMIEDGATILDIGGESSRPGADLIDSSEEKRRVVPVIRAIRKQHATTPLSVDTMKADVARAALEAGADIINDISALTFDPAMASIIVQHNAWVVLMHNRSQRNVVLQEAAWGPSYQAPDYKDVLGEVIGDLQEHIAFARSAGISQKRIILDPGIGFGKSVEQNLTLINHLDHLCALGYPVLIGTSRKNFIGRVLEVPVEERLEGTAATVVVALERGASLLRVHDVKFMARVVMMTEAIRKAGGDPS